MPLPGLVGGRIQRRYKRFLADVELDGGALVVAHVPNTGTMASCWEPGAAVQLSHSDNPRRKLAWTLERVDMGAGWIGVNTARPNQLAAAAVEGGHVAPLDGYGRVRREVRFEVPGKERGRLDLGLYDGKGLADALVEVKNVTLLDGHCLRFPDAVSERGRKHLKLLEHALGHGMRAVMLFVLNRPEGDRFAPAWDIDPAYARRLCEVAAAGVELIALRALHLDGGIGVGGLVDIHLR